MPGAGAGVTADMLALRLVDMMRASNKNFAAWQMNPEEKTYIAMHRGANADQVLLRIRFTEEGQELVGVLSVMVDGDTALVSGFQAPIPLIETMKPIFQYILVGYNNYWANGLGQVIGSNLGDSPGYGFQKLEPM
jgi:hypothetical protein